MGARLGVEVTDTEGVNLIRLSGVIDEDNDLLEITKQVKRPTVLINTSDVERINSCGVRDWVTWLGELQRQGCTIFLLECSPAIMTQVNLVNNFVGNGIIASFYAPYFCSSCESDKMLLINVEDALKGLPFHAPTCRCDQCDHTMEFDDIESSYFGFLNTLTQPRIEASLDQVIKRLTRESKGTLRTRSTSMPLPSVATPSTPSAGSSSSSGASGIPPMPTIPSGNLKGLLTDVAYDKVGQQQQEHKGGIGKLLYLIVALLAAAIALLGYVVLRSGS
ncbi:MAG: anti-sigma factor antagonist [Deltaproteobacteria bacterium]|nr:anti-sigma factor antagonist [Deltaproteobacteria bacterium]